MSDIPEDFKLPAELPECPCFQQDTAKGTMDRISDVANQCLLLTVHFIQAAREAEMCSHGLPYMVEMLMVSLLTCITRIRNPELTLGTNETEAEVEKALLGIEGRIRMRMREAYEVARKYEMTDEKMAAIFERNKGGTLQ